MMNYETKSFEELRGFARLEGDFKNLNDVEAFLKALLVLPEAKGWTFKRGKDTILSLGEPAREYAERRKPAENYEVIQVFEPGRVYGGLCAEIWSGYYPDRTDLLWSGAGPYSSEVDEEWRFRVRGNGKTAVKAIFSRIEYMKQN